MDRRTFFWIPLLAGALPMIVTAANESTSAAQAAAKAWLKRLDAADYPGTWETAATMFKSAVSAQAWQQASQPVRQPLGAVRSRSDKSAVYTKSLPGVPDGEYVVIQFNTTFEKKAEAVETVTMALDRDGSWRVAGYFIK
jgi:Protein of unknown function (DUF4019)